MQLQGFVFVFLVGSPGVFTGLQVIVVFMIVEQARPQIQLWISISSTRTVR